MENDSVCSMSFVSSNLELNGREDQSALVVRDNQYFQKWTGKHEFNCKFTVTSSLGLGVFAVIQHMSFRRNAQGQCIDYIQVCIYVLSLFIIMFNCYLITLIVSPC